MIIILDKILVSVEKLEEIFNMLPKGEAKEKFKDFIYGTFGNSIGVADEYKFSEKKSVIMYGDDGEGYMTLIRSVDGDIWFTLDTTPASRSIRHRTSGSALSMNVQLEVTRTLNYLMYLLEYGYEKGSEEHMKKIITHRMKGNH